MQLSEAARRLLEIFDPEGFVIGGICGAIYGVERFTRDVDLAVSLDPEQVLARLQDAGVEASVRKSSEPDDLSWVISGQMEGVEFQVLPASETGLEKAVIEVRAGLRIPDVKSFIVSKCIAAGQQDMHDVAALCLMHSELEPFAKEMAKKQLCLNKLQLWLEDKRLRQRYGP